MNHLGKIVEAAINAATLEDAQRVQAMIAKEIGARHKRPLFDTVDNYGAVTGGSGSYDVKSIELDTNMQDTVLEREALRKFGSTTAVPYRSPMEAAKALFEGISYEELASRAVIEIRESDLPTKKTKRISLVNRDKGCGLTPESVPDTIFGLHSTKKDLPWQQGAFGIGGRTAYRNARAVVLVTRRDPKLLAGGEEDRIAIAVVEWEFQGKTQTASYLVTRPWKGPGDHAPVFSIPASSYPEFEPGTHLVLISFGVEHIQTLDFRDTRSLYVLLNTRLYDPVIPIRVARPGGHPDNARGLKRRLEDNPGDPPRPTSSEMLPFSSGGRTYQLPVTYYVFSGQGEGAGERRRFVAPGHAVIFTSNGQTHHQWADNEFRDKIPTLQRLADRILVVVQTDELPIELRTTLFTADRSAMMRTDEALRLEREVAAFLREWDDLTEIHSELVRKALSNGQAQKSTVNLAKELGKAFQGIGFGIGTVKRTGTGGVSANGTAGGEGVGNGPGTGSHPPGKPTPALELYPDPTMLDGPESAVAVRGESKFLHYRLNAYDGFVPDRAQIQVVSDHELIGEREITVGRLSRGRLRVSVAVPEEMAEGTVTIRVLLPQWVKRSGGLGGPLEWSTKLEIATTLPVPGSGTKPGKNSDKKGTNGNSGRSSEGPGAGDIIPVIWKNVPQEPLNVGSAERMAAKDVAAARPEYTELSVLGDSQIWVVLLNEDYTNFKKYNAASVRTVSDKTRENRRLRYGRGVGTGMLAFAVQVEKMKQSGTKIEDDVIDLTRQSIAAAVLADMKAYDELAEAAGIERMESKEPAPAVDQQLEMTVS